MGIEREKWVSLPTILKWHQNVDNKDKTQLTLWKNVSAGFGTLLSPVNKENNCQDTTNSCPFFFFFLFLGRSTFEDGLTRWRTRKNSEERAMLINPLRPSVTLIRHFIYNSVCHSIIVSFFFKWELYNFKNLFNIFFFFYTKYILKFHLYCETKNKSWKHLLCRYFVK